MHVIKTALTNNHSNRAGLVAYVFHYIFLRSAWKPYGIQYFFPPFSSETSNPRHFSDSNFSQAIHLPHSQTLNGKSLTRCMEILELLAIWKTFFTETEYEFIIRFVLLSHMNCSLSSSMFFTCIIILPGGELSWIDWIKNYFKLNSEVNDNY